ncbi:MAG: hypothetical protein KDH89_11725 [Anaerolineae bacterium]|nr:hypothetical protein [Anaerolineae bacterium]
MDDELIVEEELLEHASDDEDEMDCPEGEDCTEVSAEQAMIFASLPELELEMEYEDGDIEPISLEAALSKPRRYVRKINFRNWAVAKQERNKNGDFVSSDNLSEFITSIGTGYPVTDVHPSSGRPTIFGIVTGGNKALVEEDGSVNEYAMTNGFWWSGRYPKLVRETISGDRLPSIEAMATEEECSLCGYRFGPGDPPCDHLQPLFAGSKLPDNVSRLHYGLKAIGVASVRNPAGSDVGFHEPRFYLAASELEDNDMDEQNVPDTSAFEAQIATLTDEKAALEAENTTMKATLEASEAKLPILRQRVVTLLDTGAPIERVKQLVVAEDMLTMPDTTFALVCETLKPAPKNEPVPASPTVVADEKDDPGFSWNRIYGE